MEENWRLPSGPQVTPASGEAGGTVSDWTDFIQN